MKKLFTFVLFCAVAISLQAQSIEKSYIEVSENLKNKQEQAFLPFENVFQNIIKKGQVSLAQTAVNKTYTTSEFIHPASYEDPEFVNEMGFEATEPTPESKTTDGYVQAVIRIPAGYTLNPQPNVQGYFTMGLDNAVLITIDGTPSLFAFDYKIKLESASLQKQVKKQEINELTENEYANSDNAKLITVKYSPSYFTLQRDYPYAKDVPNTLGKKVSVIPILSAQAKGCKPTYFFLVPNVENLYKDFKFVKEGPSPVIYEKIKNELHPDNDDTSLARVK